MIGPSVVVSVISVGVRGVIAANYGKFYDRPTWVFNGTALLVSFVVKAAFSWSVRDKNKRGRPIVTTTTQINEFGIMTISQIAGHLAGVVALNALGQSLARDDALAYTFSAGVASDLVAILDNFH